MLADVERQPPPPQFSKSLDLPMLWKYLGPHIWNSLLNQISKEIDYTKFEEFVNDWFGMKCK